MYNVVSVVVHFNSSASRTVVFIFRQEMVFSVEETASSIA
jgi:hypothetical protein